MLLQIPDKNTIFKFHLIQLRMYNFNLTLINIYTN